jgi:biopolymer transport protein ExbD
MKIDLDNGTDDAQIQIVPLIDVIFCILTFFILAVLQLRSPQGMNVDIPNAATGTVQPPERLIVTLSPTGQTYVGQDEVDRNSLADRARKYLESKPDGLVVLNASQNAFYSDVIGILDLMRKVGGSRVALATNPAVTTPPTPILQTPGFGTPGLTNPSLGTPGNSGLFPYGSPGTTPTPTPLVPGGVPQPGLQPGSSAPLGSDPNNPIGQPNPGSNQPLATPPGTGIAPQSQDQVIPVEPVPNP